ncbi:MAG: hypothetical protein SGI74_08310 [Oligoflexia bacterium]|nr:hypothetical protein [Oligoflexia bacterium]
MKSFRFLKKWQAIRPIIAITLSFSITILVFQNCGDSKLKTKSVSASVVIGSQAALKLMLSPPVAINSYGRLVVIVDTSSSAIKGTCVNEVDHPQYVENGSATDCAKGFDRTGDRFVWIKKWIESLRAFPEYAGNSGEGLKILIVPYAGGSHNRPKKDSEDAFYMEDFRTPDQALKYVDILEKEQQNAVAAAPNETPMGTSFVYKGLLWAYDKMKVEFYRLGENARHARWDVVIVGDGVRRPRVSDFNKLVSPCNAKGEFVAGAGAEYMRTECLTWVNKVKPKIGDPDDNDPNKSWYKAQQIFDMPRVRGFGNKTKIQLVQPHLENIDEDLRKPISKISDLVKNQDKINQLQYLEDRMNLKIFTSSSPTVLPTKVGGMSYYSKTYKIADFTVLNLNARVDSTGTLIIDSDVDGVADKDEITTSPTNARSNGTCLDGIEARGFTCKINGCDKNNDSDADGLNECEELSLGTSDLEMDSDSDGIPDLYEFLYETRMYSNDRELKSDTTSNFYSFAKGVVGHADLLSVDPRFLVETSFKETTSQNLKPRYTLQIKAVPLVQTLEVTRNTNPLWRGIGNPRFGILPNSMLGGIIHSAGMNEVVILLRLVSQEQGESIFFIGRLPNVNYTNPVIPKLKTSIFKQVSY